MHRLRKKLLSKTLIVGILLTSIIPHTTFAEKQLDIRRLSGENRYETSANICIKNFSRPEYIVLASGENFADALSATNFSKDAPILLTTKNKIPNVIKKTITRSNSKNIIIVGGEKSVSKNVEDQLRKENNVKRISGKDRFETSILVANSFKDNKDFVACNGLNFADSLTATPYILQNNKRLILTNGKTLSKNVDSNRIKEIIGGEKSMNISELNNVKRISGRDRYETSLKVNKDLKNFALLVSGENYPDALSASPMAMKFNTGILLVNKNSAYKIKQFIQQNEINELVTIGGEKSITNETINILTDKISEKSKNYRYDRLLPQSNDDSNLTNFNINTPLSAKEKELARLVNEYRVSKGLKPMPVSKSLTYVARTHNKDQIQHFRLDLKDSRGLKANSHSWSKYGNWTPMNFTEDHKYDEYMWNKPKELTNFKVNGYEIAHYNYIDNELDFKTNLNAIPKDSLNGWKRSPGHNDVIVGNNGWDTLSVMGVSIHGNFADIWFADETNDPAGFHSVK